MTTFFVDDLSDPHELKREYPNINIIQDVYKKNIQVGYYVKLRRNGAYFWVKITHIDGETLTGEIYHPIICNANFTIGDFIIFQVCYVMDIYDPYTFELIPRSYPPP
jgi:hypothetical protein